MGNIPRTHGEAILSHTADYALRALLALARAGKPLKAAEIADCTGSPRNYMSKTLSVLASRGLLHSRRGPSGGFTLAIPPARLTVAEVAAVFAEERPPSMCLLADRPCRPEAPCAAHDRWMEVIAATRAPLAVTIAELLDDDHPTADRAHPQGEE